MLICTLEGEEAPLVIIVFQMSPEFPFRLIGEQFRTNSSSSSFSVRLDKGGERFFSCFFNLKCTYAVQQTERCKLEEGDTTPPLPESVSFMIMTSTAALAAELSQRSGFISKDSQERTTASKCPQCPL